MGVVDVSPSGSDPLFAHRWPSRVCARSPSVAPELRPSGSAASGMGRDFQLLVSANETVKVTRRLAVQGIRDLPHLLQHLQDELGTEPLAIVVSGSTAPLQSLDELGARSKILLHPASKFERAAPPAAAPRVAAVQKRASGPTKRFTVLVLKNEIVSNNTKVVVEGGSVQELEAAIESELGLNRAVNFLMKDEDFGDEFVQVRSLDDVPPTCKIRLQYKPGSVARAAPAKIPVAASAGPARNFMLLIMKNETIQNTEKVLVAATSLAELTAAVAKQCGLAADEIVLSKAGEVASASKIESIDEVKEKDKLMVWKKDRLGGSRSNVRTPQRAAATVRATASVASVAAVAELAGPPREFTLLVCQNDLVKGNRLVKCTATTLAEVIQQICTELKIRKAVTISIAGSLQGPAVQRMADLPSKAKVQMWPAAAKAAAVAVAAVAKPAAVAVAALTKPDDMAGRLAEVKAAALADPPASTAEAPKADEEVEVDLIPGTKWMLCQDETDGAQYYYNVETEESTWEEPPAVTTATEQGRKDQKKKAVAKESKRLAAEAEAARAAATKEFMLMVMPKPKPINQKTERP